MINWYHRKLSVLQYEANRSIK